METAQLIKRAGQGRWDETRAWAWYDKQPWRVGCNFIPSRAINQLEMWQADSFDRVEIDRELGWLEDLGMNTVRVYLHDLLWKEDSGRFLARIDQFLGIAALHNIAVMFVFFDSCWFPYPELGRQRPPTPHRHNSHWVQSPGAAILRDARAFAALEGYVTGVVEHFRDDPRIFAWDIWNEPDNCGSDGREGLTVEEKTRLVTPYLADSFQWARAGRPSQPLTSAIWQGDWVPDEKMIPLHQVQVFGSDIISFHRYLSLEETRATVEPLKRWGRPLLCTEYLARGAGSTFEAILPYFHREKIAAYNWGAVSGKTQTIYPWDSGSKTYTSEPEVWHHDIFRPDGTPYDSRETELIKSLLKPGA